ncbi:hypothetical protein OHT20_38890 [Streptomyces caniferus]|uniref:hypothetical protein n=1 Tax=Streptomyces caniferus TaxID=285557 RepID=UPI002E27DAC3|nr:hypothetical protein [Streptomyces caniferus]
MGSDWDPWDDGAEEAELVRARQVACAGWAAIVTICVGVVLCVAAVVLVVLVGLFLLVRGQ